MHDLNRGIAKRDLLSVLEQMIEDSFQLLVWHTIDVAEELLYADYSLADANIDLSLLLQVVAGRKMVRMGAVSRALCRACTLAHRQTSTGRLRFRARLSKSRGRSRGQDPR